MDQPQPRVPPRYVPTLTDIVTGLQAPQAVVAADATAGAALPPQQNEVAPALPDPPAPVATLIAPSAADAAVAEEQLVQRLLQRVEQALDQKLQACIAQVVQEQTRSITLRLQEELESVVRQTVHDAVAQELATGAQHL